MNVADLLFESWHRQCAILDSVASLINQQNRGFKPSEDGWPIDAHLAHMHGTRCYFLSQVAPDLCEGLPSAFVEDTRTPHSDLDYIKSCLTASGQAIEVAVRRGLEPGGPLSGGHVVYDSPVLLLQHMVWHEGWHVGLIFLALRVNGQEPPEEWEERKVWGQWRTETW